MMFNAATVISDDTFPSKYTIFTFLHIIYTKTCRISHFYGFLIVVKREGVLTVTK
jgi:hypothetical protein